MKTWPLSHILLLLTFLLFTGILGSCKEDEIIEEEKIDPSVIAVNGWIKDVMEYVYLWRDKIPSGIDYRKEPDSEAYFGKLLYPEEDKWSWITDDYESLMKELEGEPVTMGYAPVFYRFGDGDDVFMVIKYVYLNSAADKAGVKRGDIFLAIDGRGLTTSNYYELYSGRKYTATLGVLSGNTLLPSGRVVTLEAQVTVTDPVLYTEVFHRGGKKIGYLVYTEFLNGKNDVFLDRLDAVFDEFREAGVTELIVDLRYNGGGEISAAAHLASAIAPRSVVNAKSVLVNVKYNSLLQSYYESGSQHAHRLSYTFPANSHNLDLHRVCFLTTGSTASASELLMIGLAPYMSVVQIGENTRGKYTGGWVIPDLEEPPTHNWAMVPIVMKYENINQFTEFKNGLSPTIYMSDNLLAALPFGNTEDPMLATALSFLAGEPALAVAKSAPVRIQTQELRPRQLEIKQSLIVPLHDAFGAGFIR